MRRRFLLAMTAIAVAVGALLFAPAAALAQEIENSDTAVAPVAGLHLDEFTVLIITSLLIPFLTGLATKVNAPASVKQIITAAISAIVGVVTTSTQVDGTAIISLTTVQYALLSFAIATVGYLGLYKPHDLDAKLAPDSGLERIGPIGAG